MTASLRRRAACEFVASAFLLATVVGSGIAGAKLSGGNVAIALLANSLATGAMLTTLILVFGPISGAHMNPAVSLSFALAREMRWRDFIIYCVAQLMGAIGGVLIANAMFELPPLQIATTARTGNGQWFSEGIATFGLLMTIFGCVVNAKSALPYAVGLYITAAYWFTASTSFANPAVTIARSFTDTFSGIAPADVVAFVSAQLVGAVLATSVMRLLVKTQDAAEGGVL